MKEISFCISVKNRFEQISRTLIKNLNDNFNHREKVEFVIVDFSSTDHLQSWIFNNFKEELNTGYLAYYYTEELKYWHMSVAKNTAHLYSTGNICVNLDCDNFTGKNGGLYIAELYKNRGKDIVVHQFSGRFGDGTCGRISMLKRHFNDLGGYNEEFKPVGYQDIDLIRRAMRHNLHYLNILDPIFNVAIENPKFLSIRHCNSTISWQEMENENKMVSERNLSENILVANQGRYGIRNNVYKYVSGKLVKAKYCSNL